MSVGSTHHLEVVLCGNKIILVDEYFFCCTWIVNSAYKIGVSRGPFVFKNFINRGAGNTELMSNFQVNYALLMKRQHDVPVHGTPRPV